MNPTEYVEAAIATESRAAVVMHLGERESRVFHAVMGCCTEAGEMLDQLKKHVFYGQPVDDINLIEEAGGLLWYLAVLSDALAAPLDEIMERNIAKLKKRYPDKFAPDAALNRDLDAERKVLELDPVCHDDVGDGSTIHDDRPRPGASSEADEKSAALVMDHREQIYLKVNNWNRQTDAGGGRRETWTMNWATRKQAWPQPIFAKHGGKDVWSRQEALNLQREIDWFKEV